jgi:hypothetical protein
MNDIVIVKCYGTEKKYKRKDAIREFKTAVEVCEGSERERYMNILLQLLDGDTYCCDEWN